MPLYNWSVVSCSNAAHPDLFQLVDETGGEYIYCLLFLGIKGAP